MIHKINIKFPEEFTITSATTNKSELNVILEKIYVPKNGDIIYTKGNRIQYGNKLLSSIGIFKEIKDDKIYCHCELFLESNRLVRYPHPQYLRSNQIIRPATKNQITFLFENMTDSKLIFDNINKTLIKTYEPKHGDFVHIGKRYDKDVEYLAIYDNTEIDESINEESYRSIVDIEIGNGKLEARFDVILPTNKPIRLATEEQRQTIINVLKSEGFEWNDKTKTLEEIYVPKVGDICIAWSYKSYAIIGKVIHIDNHVYSIGGEKYENCIKYESMEQYLEILNSKK